MSINVNKCDIKSLDHACEGDLLRIVSVKIEGALKDRLESLGFLPGEFIEVLVKNRFLSDALVVGVGGTRIALRSGEASLILVS